jgi:beta-galactosidase/beta-glucuronidase
MRSLYLDTPQGIERRQNLLAVSMNSTSVRSEYPRPQFVRQRWQNLNGEWEFEFDDENVGIQEHWEAGKPFSRRIVVPFSPETPLSGVRETGRHDMVWYRRTFRLSADVEAPRIVLHVGAVDYYSMYWVNGVYVGSHEGGQTPVSFDITQYLTEGENVLVIRAEDDSRALDQPRGKQCWEDQPSGIFYTRTTGIWQSVWLEGTSELYLDNLWFTPDIDNGCVRVQGEVRWAEWCRTHQYNDIRVGIDISFEDEPVAHIVFQLDRPTFDLTIPLHDFAVHSGGRLWSPDHPNLYDVVVRIYLGDDEVDCVQSYFGMRKISVENGRILLNNRPFFMRLVLDQGYFPEGGLTAPSDDALKADVEWAKRLGFNGVRKHQKVEDPRFLYWCDRLGLVVWGEMANSQILTHRAIRRMTDEWQAVIRRDYNHPCIIAWVPLNESWGVPHLLTDSRHRAHAKTLYWLTKSLDPTRLVISNDGWEHTVTDLCTIHDYDPNAESLRERYATPEAALSAMPGHRFIYVPGYPYRGEPILVTECGGISFKCSDWDGWGYSGADSEEDFLSRYEAIVGTLLQSPVIQGFCYTQLTDVEQEINGLLTFDRRPKVDQERIREINTRPRSFCC